MGIDPQHRSERQGVCVSVMGQEQEADETKTGVSSLEKVVLSESQPSFSSEVSLGAWC